MRRGTERARRGSGVAAKMCAAVVALVVTAAHTPLALFAQNPTPQAPVSPHARRAAEIVRGMTPQQRIGQLFLVSFPGSDVALTSDIADLIVNYRVGGVVLKASEQNFADGNDGTRQVTQLATSLQSLASLTVTAILSPSAPISRPTGSFVPLFIAVNFDGDGSTPTEISQGLTQGPSQLALGATWKPEHATTVGRIVGHDLANVGVNLLLGPNLDVLDSPKPGQTADPGTRVFGGDPYWVGRFGAAFTSGVHQGSDNRVAVIAKNFPGLGSSDRNIEEEIPTVQKSLEQLKQVELAPFFAVTALDGRVITGLISSTEVVDGLQVSHIRYRGFQGNIRASTRPVSFDPQAYQDLMSLPEIAPWRAIGGLTVSDALGVRSVRRFYDPQEVSFNARQVARDAFLAGNDVLNLGSFSLSPSWPEQLANTKDTLNFFRERYVNEPAFAARVDAAVTRIVALKLKLYGGNFAASNIVAKPSFTPTPEATTNPASAPGDPLAAIARDSLALLSPSVRELPAILPSAPSKDESIVFISDDRLIRACARCQAYPAIPRTALQDIVLRLYGPRTTGQVNPARVSSFTFSDLADYGARSTATLTPTLRPSPSPTSTLLAEATISATTVATESLVPKIQTAIDNANWIVISLMDLNPAQRSTKLFRDFLALRGDTLRDKRVIVYAFGSPNNLDLTDISKVTAYVGVFSRMPAWLEASMKSLFGEYGYAGASPVSVPALNYSLTEQTAPDPARDIPLLAGDAIARTPSTPGALQLKIGDKLKLRAGPVLDRNGRLVPDGTPVQFLLSYPSERVEGAPAQALTRDGLAETTVPIERKGTLMIRAQADRAIRSYIVRVDIGENTASIETLRPTPLPTNTVEPTPTPTTVKPTNAVTSTPLPPAPELPRPDRTNAIGFVATLLLLGGATWLALLLMRSSGSVSSSSQVRVVALGWTAGWLVYAMAALGVFGNAPLGLSPGWIGALPLSLLACLFILVVSALFTARKT